MNWDRVPAILWRWSGHRAAFMLVAGMALGGATASISAADPVAEMHPAATQPADSVASPKAAAAPRSIAAAGDELMLFQDLPVVVSAARQSQPINLSSIPISVISSEDIHHSARTTLPEILQLQPGVDVLRIDRNDYAVGVRGLHHTFADRTLTLINGRDAGNPVFGGADFPALPVMLEDIERIEIVRGPGGAAWGANAFNGVINIITKKPEDVRGFLLSTTADEFGDTYSQARWAAVDGRWAWRVSAGYENRVSSGDALDNDLDLKITQTGVGPLIHPAGVNDDDFAKNFRFDGEATYQFSDQAKLTFGLADATEQRGAHEFLGLFPPGKSYIEVVRAFARIDCKESDSASGYLQWFTNYESLDDASLGEGQMVENDLEGQWSFATGPHKLTVGGNVRGVYSEMSRDKPTDLIGGAFPEFWGGLFAIDRWQITERLALEGQIRGDYYSAIGADWSGRLTALYALDAANHHVLRLSGARAFRTPQAGVREVEGGRLPLPSPAPPGFDAINFVSADNLSNEHVTSVEAGYNGQLADGVSVRVDTFYQQYKDLIGGQSLPDPLGAGRDFETLRNLGGADSYGVETELGWSPKNSHYSVWYALNDFVPDQHNQDTRSFRPVRNQAGVNARWFVGAGWTLAANYKFADSTSTSVGKVVGVSHQLDLTVAKSLFDGKGEVAVGVADVLDSTRFGVAEEGQFTAHDTPGRTVFARVQAKW